MLLSLLYTEHMRTWLIKFGKIWAIMRQDGLLRASRRVFEASLQLARPIGSGDVLLISGGAGDSARYRTRHVAEELCLRGFRAEATIQDHRGLEAAADRFQVFVFHRTSDTPKLRQFIQRLKTLGRTLIFETDDLVFDPAYLVHMDYWHQMNALERKQYEHGVGGEILADAAVAVATTTTSFLAEKLRERGKQVFIVPNRLSQQDLVWAERAMEKLSTRDPRLVCLGYLSGTPSHNQDFATLTDALGKLFQAYPHVRLVVVGPLEIGDALKQYTDRIEHRAFVPRSELFATIASLDINLAPLVIGNPFCEAKSELKFFEAGIVGVPTVAAATGTFRQAIADGVDGLVAATSDEWYAKLARLVDDAALRAHMGHAARATALARYSTAQANNEEYYGYLRNQLSTHNLNVTQRDL